METTKQQQPKVEFLSNVPKTLTFKFNQPKTGTSQYGTWYFYGVLEDGVDKSYFATDLAHQEIQKRIGQSKTLIITRKEKIENNKRISFFEVSSPSEAKPVQRFTAELDHSINQGKQDEMKEVWDAKDNRMARMSAIKSAVEITKDANEVLRVANIFYNWIYGKETKAIVDKVFPKNYEVQAEEFFQPK